MSLNLLRSTNYHCTKDEIWPIHYEYALYPHDGCFEPIEIDRLAKQSNAEYLYGGLDLTMPHFNNPVIEITCWKPAHDREGYILRAFDRSEKGANTLLTLPKGYVLCGEVNLLEDQISMILAQRSSLGHLKYVLGDS